MTITTIIVIVLALIVLVVLLLGFTGGWGNLWGRITSFFSSSNNVDSIVQACQYICTTSTEKTYDFCTTPRTLKYEGADGKLTKATVTCNTLKAGKNAKNEGIGLPKSVTDVVAAGISCDMQC